MQAEICLIRLSCLAGPCRLRPQPSVCDAVSADWNLRLNLRRDSQPYARRLEAFASSGLGLAREVPKASAVAPESGRSHGCLTHADWRSSAMPRSPRPLSGAAGHRRRRWWLTSIAVTKMTKRPKVTAVSVLRTSCRLEAITHHREQAHHAAALARPRRPVAAPSAMARAPCTGSPSRSPADYHPERKPQMLTLRIAIVATPSIGLMLHLLSTQTRMDRNLARVSQYTLLCQ